MGSKRKKKNLIEAKKIMTKNKLNIKVNKFGVKYLHRYMYERIK
jgi:hypothetical protein